MSSPTMLLFEDIHWADTSQLDLLETLGGACPRRPRHVRRARAPRAARRPAELGGGLPAYTALPLDPLTADCSQELAERLLARRRRWRRGRRKVAETAEGNPLFIEELAAIDRRALDRGRAADERARDHRGPARLAPVRTSAASSWTRRSPAESSGAARSPRWRRTMISRARSARSRIAGSSRARPCHGSRATSSIAFKHVSDPATSRTRRSPGGAGAGASRRGRPLSLERDGRAGQSHEALAHHWRDAGEPERAVDELIAAARARRARLGQGSRGHPLLAGARTRRRQRGAEAVDSPPPGGYRTGLRAHRPGRRGTSGESRAKRRRDRRSAGSRRATHRRRSRRSSRRCGLPRKPACSRTISSVGRVVDAERLRVPVAVDDDVAVLPDDLGVAVMADRLRARRHGRKHVHVDGVRPLDEIPRHGLIVA